MFGEKAVLTSSLGSVPAGSGKYSRCIQKGRSLRSPSNHCPEPLVGIERSEVGEGDSSGSPSGGIATTISVGKSILGQSAKSLVRACHGVRAPTGSSKGKNVVAFEVRDLCPGASLFEAGGVPPTEKPFCGSDAGGFCGKASGKETTGKLCSGCLSGGRQPPRAVIKLMPIKTAPR